MKKLTRRKFLYSSSFIVGLGMSTLNLTKEESQLISQSQIAPHSVLQQQESSSSHPAPTGMFAPPKGDVRLVVFSDLNSRYGSVDYISEVMQAVKILPAWKADLVVCAGDMVAGQSLALSNMQVQAMWTAFDQKIFQPIRATGLPYVMTLGNHDASSYKDRSGQYVFQVDRQAANNYWSNQDLGLNFIDKSGFPFFYSFQYGEIFFLIWDASSASISDKEIAWADKLLGSEIAQNASMRIVMGHLPMYAVAQGRDRQGEFLYNADQLQALLERHQVHTYICGHHHVYFPGRVGDLEILHVGALGSGPRSWLTSAKTAMHTLTIIDINLTNQDTLYTTYNMGNLQVISMNQIPRLIVGPNGREIRRDLEFADLTTAERNQKHILSK